MGAASADQLPKQLRNPTTGELEGQVQYPQKSHLRAWLSPHSMFSRRRCLFVILASAAGL